MSSFSMKVGHYYRGDPFRGRQDAEPTARSVIEALAISQPAPDVLEVSFKEANETFHVGPSNPEPAGFSKAGGPISGEQALVALARALGNKDTYWFDEFATDQNVTSDGVVVRWQDAKFYVDENDRSQFNGLWLYELRRTGESEYHILIRRIPAAR
ncbi:MAG: hypothetical protein HYZ26_01185 [Chloroflexi bacterium]|nr:hypothetical protein [Chloroflexota bacterium]